MKFEKTWGLLLGQTMSTDRYWADRGEIPLGALKPYEMYEGEIPMSDIVRIKFDPANAPATSRKANNILCLGGSGDGKSLIMKNAWSVLHKMNYYVCYIDPKSTDSGRARVKWEGSPRLAPNMQAEGIPLDHFMPAWAVRKQKHLAHNWRQYTTRLKYIDERELWQGIGMRIIGASVVTKLVNRLSEKELSLSYLRNRLFDLDKEDLPAGSFDNVMRVLTNLEDFKVVSSKYQELDMMKVWKQGKSISISYNNASKIFMTFDIGLKIKQASDYYYTHDNRKPIYFMFDDGSYYAQVFDSKIVPYNLALHQIIDIGFNYRSLGLMNWLSVQSLGIIDENVAETYKTKLISPMFANPDSLSNINIPKKAITYLKSDKLVKDSKRHLMQWILINEDNDVIPFFPFTPPCNHFQEIYFPKKEVVET